jgi:hypothetical protein
MDLTTKLTQDQSSRLLALKDAAAKLLPPLARAWGSGAQEVLGRAVKARFTGKGPFPVSQNRLGIVTNRLRKSMRAAAVQVNEGSGVMSVSMGSNVSYFGPHEFGFQGRVQVRGHTRKAVADTGRTARGRLSKSNINQLKNSKLVRGRSNFSYVKPHSRQVKTPARRPLGTELEAPATKATFYQKINSVMRRVLGIK